jgi:hypothetical protein
LNFLQHPVIGFARAPPQGAQAVSASPWKVVMSPSFPFALLASVLAVAGCNAGVVPRTYRPPGPDPERDAGWIPPDPDPPPPGTDAGPAPPPPPTDAGGGPTPDAPVFVIDAPTPIPDPGACTYPTGATSTMSTGSTISPYRWATAYTADGRAMRFDLEAFHCRAGEWGEGEWARYHSVLFVVGTGWCSNCPEYLRTVAAMDLPSRGTLVVYLESQDESYRSVNSAGARRTVDRTIGTAEGLRIGDAENSPPDAIGDQTSSIPAGYFVRRSDMQVLADENELGFTPPWTEMAANPELDWPARFGVGPPPACTEEPYEPNDSRSAAARIGVASFDAGICGSDSDYYAVTLTRRFRVDLRFSHAAGDIDLFALDSSGATVGVSESADDDESLTLTGPVTLRVFGYDGARAPYHLTITEL